MIGKNRKILDKDTYSTQIHTYMYICIYKYSYLCVMYTYVFVHLHTHMYRNEKGESLRGNYTHICHFSVSNSSSFFLCAHFLYMKRRRWVRKGKMKEEGIIVGVLCLGRRKWSDRKCWCQYLRRAGRLGWGGGGMAGECVVAHVWGTVSVFSGERGGWQKLQVVLFVSAGCQAGWGRWGKRD